MWVNRHELNNSLVVFLHGIFGERWATWKGIPDVLQDRAATDPLISSYDVYLFEYETRIFRQPFLDPYVIDDLDRFLSSCRSKYRTTVLIGHSQGGILAKLYVTDKLIREEGELLTIDKIVTFGTPHRGLRVLNLLLLLQNIPLAKSLLPF